MNTDQAPHNQHDVLRAPTVVVRELTDDVKLLVSQEVELAKLELGAAVGAIAKGVGAFIFAAIVGLYFLDLLLETFARVLSIWLVDWAAWLIVTGVVFVLIAAVAGFGYRQFKNNAVAMTATKEEAAESLRILKEKLGEAKDDIQSAVTETAQAAAAAAAAQAMQSNPDASPGARDE